MWDIQGQSALSLTGKHSALNALNLDCKGDGYQTGLVKCLNKILISRATQYIALATTRNIGASVLLVMYIKINRQSKVHGYMYVETTQCTFFRCYSSSNRDVDNLENMLEEIAAYIRTSNGNYVVTGNVQIRQSRSHHGRLDCPKQLGCHKWGN